MFYWVLKYVVAGPLIRLYFRLRVTGLENLPKQGALIVASNHLSVIDSFILPIALPRRMTFLARSEYFGRRGIGTWISRNFLKGVGMLPIDRAGGSASEASLRTGIEVLERGGLIAIYPEGTRSPDGALHKGRTGVARMVLGAHCRVVPVAVLGTERVMPRGVKFPRSSRVTIKVGVPLDFDDHRQLVEDGALLRTVTDEIMTKIGELSGQEYVDTYASTSKRAAAGD